MFDRLASHLAERTNSPFDFAVIDEAQDINPAQLKFIAALSGDLPNSLFLRATYGGGSFKKPSPGSQLVSMLEIVHTSCKLITARLIKSENKLTVCFLLN